MRVGRDLRLETLVWTKSIKGEFRFYPDGNQQSPTFERGLGQGQIFVLQRSTWDREKKSLRENELSFDWKAVEVIQVREARI